MHFVALTFLQPTSDRAYYDGSHGSAATWFDYSQNECRVLPHVLLSMIRTYFPRGVDGSVSYPPPFTEEGGCGFPDNTTYPYPLEFVNLVGASCVAVQVDFPSAVCYEEHSSGDATDYPPYLRPGHGSPHYCSEMAKLADVNNDWCPYIFFGDERGQYRHPHIAYAAVEVWLANQAGINDGMGFMCGETWDDNDGAN